jgi:hypothetical protein
MGPRACISPKLLHDADVALGLHFAVRQPQEVGHLWLFLRSEA